MTWSYSGDPSSSDKDAIRFLIGDTDTDDQLVNDEEITYLLTVEGNTLLAAARAAESIAAKFSRLADRKIGDYSESYNQKSEAYLKLASRLSAQAAKSGSKPMPYAGGLSRSDKKSRELDSDRVKPDFEKRMMENLSDVLDSDWFRRNF